MHLYYFQKKIHDLNSPIYDIERILRKFCGIVNSMKMMKNCKFLQKSVKFLQVTAQMKKVW